MGKIRAFFSRLRKENSEDYEISREIMQKIANRFVALQIISGSFGWIFNVLLHGAKSIPCVVTGLCTTSFIVAAIISRKRHQLTNAAWYILVVSALVQFPVVLLFSGSVALLYLLVVIVSLGFVSRPSLRTINVLAMMLIYNILILFLRNISPAWQRMPFDGFISSIIAFNLVSLSIYMLETVFLTQYREYSKLVKEQSKSKSEFLARMSHEIRTPINGIIGMNEMILRETEDKNIIKYANNARNSGKVLLNIVNDILDISKVESGKMELTPMDYTIVDVVSELVAVTSVNAQSKGLEFKWTVDPNIPSLLYGDEVKLTQIITNLLSNAVKYTDEGEVNLSIDGEVHGTRVDLFVCVKDTGHGIHEDAIEHLFDAFERVDLQYTRKIEGTGLGLNITNKLLELMGSQLKVQSEYGKGSEFYFVLTQEIRDIQHIGHLDENYLNETKDATNTKSFVAPNAKVLCVDDNKINLDVFTSLLKRTQVQVTSVESGEACLEIVQKEKFDIIFLDHMMPKMDGIETLKKFREMPANLNENTPVIALTANAVSGAREMYMSCGFSDFITKPINSLLLEKMIMDYLSDDLLEETNTGSMHESSKFNEDSTDVQLPEVEGFDWDYAKKFCQDNEIILSSYRQFRDSLPEMIEEIRGLFISVEDADSRDLCRIKVHAVKSIAAGLGQLTINQLALLAEHALRDNDVERIHGLVPILLEELDKCKNIMSSVELAGDSDSNEKKEYNQAEFIQSLKLLKDTMSEFDVDSADAIVARLRRVEYDEQIEGYVQKICEATQNIDFDGVASLCDEVLGMLE